MKFPVRAGLILLLIAWVPSAGGSAPQQRLQAAGKRKCSPRILLPKVPNADPTSCITVARIRDLQLMVDLTNLSHGCPVDLKLADRESEELQQQLQKCLDGAAPRSPKEH